MEFAEKALVLHVGRFRERDLWVRCLTPSRGIFSAFAFGGLVSRRRFSGCLDPMNQVLFRVRRNTLKGYFCLEEGVLLSTPALLRKDCNKIGLAANCLKFVEAVIRETDGSEEAYALSVDALDALNAEGEVSPLFPLFFRARLAASMGFGPRLDACSLCGRPLSRTEKEPAAFFFQVADGTIVCDCCVSRGRQKTLSLKPETAAVLERIQQTPPSEWGGLELSSAVRSEAAVVIDYFIRYHLGLAWERGTFRHV